MFKFPVIDGHADTILNQIGEDLHTDDDEDPDFNLANRNNIGHIDVPRLKEGGISGQFFAVWVDPDIDDDQYTQRAIDALDAIHEVCRKHPKKIQVAKTPSEAQQLYSKGTIAAIPCIEGGHAIKGSLRNLRTFFRLGARYMTLTWMNNNRLGDASGGDSKHGGLTEFGRCVVREMNRLGMIVDLSHVSEDTFFDAVRESKTPPIASHSCCRSINDHHRNLTDSEIEAIAEAGGVIGICFYPEFLDEDFSEAMEHARDEYGEEEDIPKEELPEVPVDRILDHIDHVVSVAGTEHVGFGSDFDGVGYLPDGMEDCSDVTDIIEELENRGYTEEEVKRIAGGNFMRVFRDVYVHARQADQEQTT